MRVLKLRRMSPRLHAWLADLQASAALALAAQGYGFNSDHVLHVPSLILRDTLKVAAGYGHRARAGPPRRTARSSARARIAGRRSHGVSLTPALIPTGTLAMATATATATTTPSTRPAPPARLQPRMAEDGRPQPTVASIPPCTSCARWDGSVLWAGRSGINRSATATRHVSCLTQVFQRHRSCGYVNLPKDGVVPTSNHTELTDRRHRWRHGPRTAEVDNDKLSGAA